VIQGDQEFSMLRSEYQGVRATLTKNEGSVVQKGYNFTAEVRVPVWINKVFASQWWHHQEAPLLFETQEERGQLHVTVENRLDREVGPVFFAWKDGLHDLGVLKPGERKSGPASRFVRQELRSFVLQHASQFSAMVQERQGAFTRAQISRNMDTPRAAIAASMLSGSSSPELMIHNPNFFLNGLLQRGDCVLLAWAPEHSPVRPFNRFAAARQSRSTLFRIVDRPGAPY
jgi:hypothetical protein